MNVREAIDASLAKLGFKEIRENQHKVVEPYVGGRDVFNDGCSNRLREKSLYWI